MKYQFTILLCILCITSQAQNSEDWVLITGTPDSNRLYYLNALRMQKQEEGINVWVKVTYKTLNVYGIEYKNPYTLAYQVFDCERKRNKILNLITYSSTGGNVLESLTYEPSNQTWNNIPPESINDDLLTVICLVIEK